MLSSIPFDPFHKKRHLFHDNAILAAPSIAPSPEFMPPTSMMAPRKRQKTNIMNEFRSISLQNITPPQDMETDDDASIVSSSSSGVELLSDREESERKVFRDLALGTIANNNNKHPVDAKVEEWLRRELWHQWLAKESGNKTLLGTKVLMNDECSSAQEGIEKVLTNLVKEVPLRDNKEMEMDDDEEQSMSIEILSE